MTQNQACSSLGCDNLLDSLPFALFVIDGQTNNVVYGNAFFRKHYPKWQEQPCHLLIHGLENPCAHCRRPDLLDAENRPKGVSLSYELFNEFDEHWYQIDEKAVYWDNGRVSHYVIASNIDKLKETQNSLAEAHAVLVLKHQELERVASTDSLTQIYNREKLGRFFAQEVERAKLTGQAFSILNADLDYFKSVNDTFGHAVGDSVLIQLARTMKDTLRASDFIGRWGGEEFLMLCPKIEHAAALQLAERIRAAVSAQEFIVGQTHTVSLGVATYRNGDTQDSLLQRADKAMYRAKNSGRNRVCGEDVEEG